MDPSRKRKNTTSVKSKVDEELLPNVSCCKLMNGSKIYYRPGCPNAIFLECSRDIPEHYLPPLPLHFAGELDSTIYFYTVRDECSDDNGKEYTFFKCSYDSLSDGPIEFQRIRKLISEKSFKFALQQPYYMEFSENIATITNFEGDKVQLTRSNSEMLENNVDTFSFFKWRGLAIIVQKNGKGKDTTVVQDTFGDKQLSVIKVKHDLPSPTSVYAQEKSSIYMLCGSTLLVFKEKLEYSTYTLNYQHCRIGGVERYRLFLNEPLRFFSHDLPQETRRTVSKRSKIQDEKLRKQKELMSSRLNKDYEVKEILGMGSFGCVFRVVSRIDEQEYALKRINVDPRYIDEVRNEAKVMAQLDHPGIVRYYDTWFEESAMYVKMQLCKSSLTIWLKEHSTSESRSPRIVKPLFKEIVEGVHYIHSMEQIHRDLKPCNILFSKDGRIKICDLGTAVPRNYENEKEKTTEHDCVCTETYMSPEQGDLFPMLNSKSDIFTLGLIFVELCIIMEDFDKKKKIFDNYREAKPNELFGDKETEEFVGRLTKKDAKQRPYCQDILNDRYMQF